MLVACPEAQRIKCKPSEYNPKHLTLMAESHLHVHSNWRSHSMLDESVSESCGVCERVQPVECCVHERLLVPSTRRDGECGLLWN